VRDLPTFRDAYRRRRCIVPVDGFFEWKAIKGQKAKQPYAIAMKDGSPFGIAGIWENWRDPASEWVRTFAILTTDANDLVADIHDRMPLILAPADYVRLLGDEPDPRDLMRPFPADLMRMWPISARVKARERRSVNRRADRVGVRVIIFDDAASSGAGRSKQRARAKDHARST
jgi:putative SOS response-associated peptidase YedK